MQQDATHFVIARTWQDFSDDFPFSEFETLPDSEIVPVIKDRCLAWLADHREAFDRIRAAKKKALLYGMRCRSRVCSAGLSPTKRDGNVQKNRRLPNWLEDGMAPLECQAAYFVGLTERCLERFGQLSPSRMIPVAAISEPAIASELAKVLQANIQAGDPLYWGELQLRIFTMSGSDMSHGDSDFLHGMLDRSLSCEEPTSIEGFLCRTLAHASSAIMPLMDVDHSHSTMSTSTRDEIGREISQVLKPIVESLKAELVSAISARGGAAQAGDRDGGDGESPSSGLVIDAAARGALWNGKKLDINQHAQFLLLAKLYESVGKIVSFQDCERAITPDNQRKAVGPSKEAPPKVKDAVKAIRRALNAVETGAAIRNAKGIGYRLICPTN